MNFSNDSESVQENEKTARRQPLLGEDAPSLTQIKMIIRECRKKKKRKHEMLISVGWNLALRLNELSGLKVDDFDFGKECVKISKKNAKMAEKDLYIVMNELSFINDVQDYIKERRLEAEDFLFCYGDDRLRYTNRRLAYMIEEAGEWIGFKAFHPHLLRHSRAKWLVENGYPMRFVQDLLRHKDAATTLNEYARYNLDERRRQGQEGKKANWGDI